MITSCRINFANRNSVSGPASLRTRSPFFRQRLELGRLAANVAVNSRNMTDPVDFRYPGTAATLKELQKVEPEAADTASDVDAGDWERKYLQKLPPDLKCSIEAIDGKISRDQLWKLADLSREDHAALSTSSGTSSPGASAATGGG